MIRSSVRVWRIAAGGFAAGLASAAAWLIALAATVFLFTGASSRYYHPGPRPVTPWRGTFGTM